MIRRGDVVTVRTFISKRRTKATVLFVNYRYGWYTALVKTPLGDKYPESFWIRDVEEMDEKHGKSKKSKNWWEEEDNPDNWLSQWDERKFNG